MRHVCNGFYFGGVWLESVLGDFVPQIDEFFHKEDILTFVEFETMLYAIKNASKSSVVFFQC